MRKKTLDDARAVGVPIMAERSSHELAPGVYLCLLVHENDMHDENPHVVALGLRGGTHEDHQAATARLQEQAQQNPESRVARLIAGGVLPITCACKNLLYTPGEEDEA